MNRLKYLFNKENRLSSILAITLFCIGILFCIMPSKMKEVLESLLCFVLLAYGGIVLFASCFSTAVFQEKKIFISMIVAVFVGLLLLFVRSILVLFLAAVLVMFALIKIFAIKHLENKNLVWWIWFCLSLSYFVISAIVLVFFVINKFYIVSMILLGIGFISEAITIIYGLIKNYTNLDIEITSTEKINGGKENNVE